MTDAYIWNLILIQLLALPRLVGILLEDFGITLIFVNMYLYIQLVLVLMG